MDWLASLFLGAFLFGLLFCVASLLLGVGHLELGHHGLSFGGHGAGGHGLGAGHGAGGQVGGAAHAAGAGQGLHVHGVEGETPNGISPWNLTGLTAFVAWFGGVGYLAMTEWSLAAWICLLLAAIAGLAGWAIVYLFFTRVLLKGETRMDAADYRLEGTVARVTVPIAGGRIGEIQYTKGGVRHSDGARSVDGAAIERGAEVVIVRYGEGLAYVEPWQEFVEGEGAPR